MGIPDLSFVTRETSTSPFAFVNVDPKAKLWNCPLVQLPQPLVGAVNQENVLLTIPLELADPSLKAILDVVGACICCDWIELSFLNLQ